jgi:dipeptidyl aminopeptidase/acylaminoacyl peptidase
VLGATLAWRGADELCFIGEQRARARVHSIAVIRDGRQGADRPLTPGDHAVAAFSIAANGQLGVIDATLTDPPDLYLVGGDGAMNRLTKLNPQVDGWKLPTISLVQWRAADGREVEGVLELPPTPSRGSGCPW